ncbi:hypothetical protein DRQ50_11830 [bacterium]|nr:MAG: hypothetical protein DRQ50_11830 [bacterium]
MAVDFWTPDQWRRISAVLDRIMELPLTEREVQLAEVCGDDPQLIREVREFLAAAERSEGYMEQSAGEAAAGLIAEAARSWQPESRLGQKLGPYELTGILGEGGMGVVYAARRSDGQYEAEVAIKLMLSISADHPLRDRFLAERQILARLDHPGVARLFDGGLDDDGHPYIVMEKVEGKTLLAHCEDAELDQRLDLFGEVCAVVDAAHRRLVLHCDLKPSNILVTAEGDLKLLDFGLARWLDPEAGGQRADTAARLKMYTPGYASPEQLRGEALSTASDVYALGVLLRDLVTGPHPRAGQSLGDLDNIIARATADIAEERYGTAHELAEDLRRYRERLPVEATPSTPWYRLRCLVNRNRGATAVLMVIFALVTTGVAATVWQARIAAAERDVAQQEAARSAAVTEFLVGLFETSDPATNKGADISAREVLDRGVAEIAALADQPDLQAQLRYVMAEVFYKLGEYEQAVELYAACLETRVALHGATSYEATDTRLALGVALLEAGNHDRAAEELQDCLDTRRLMAATEPSFLAMPIRALARLRTDQRDYVAAVALFEEAEALDPAAASVEMADLGRNHNNFAVALNGIGRHAAADTAFALAEKAYGLALDPDHPHYGALYSNWGLAVGVLGDDVRSEELHRRALDLRRKLKHNRVDIGVSLINLGNLLVKMNRAGEAVPLLEEAIAIQREAFGTNHVYVGAAIINLGLARLNMGEPALAENHFREGHRIFIEVFGADNPAVAIALTRRAQAARAAGDLDRALDLLDKSVATHRPRLPSYRNRFAETLYERGTLLEALGRVDEARTDLQETVAIFSEMFAPDHPRLLAAREALADLPD